MNDVSRKKDDCHSGITDLNSTLGTEILATSTKLPSRKI